MKKDLPAASNQISRENRALQLGCLGKACILATNSAEELNFCFQ